MRCLTKDVDIIRPDLQMGQESKKSRTCKMTAEKSHTLRQEVSQYSSQKFHLGLLSTWLLQVLLFLGNAYVKTISVSFSYFF